MILHCVVLILISVMTVDTEHFVISLLAIFISVLEKYYFCSSIHFELNDFLPLNCRHSLPSWVINAWRYTVSHIFSHSILCLAPANYSLCVLKLTTSLFWWDPTCGFFNVSVLPVLLIEHPWNNCQDQAPKLFFCYLPELSKCCILYSSHQFILVELSL